MDFDPDSILKDDALRKIWAIDDTGIVVFKMKDLNSHIFIPPKTDDTLFGIFMHPYIKPKHGSEARWDAEASVAELMDFTKDNSGVMKGLVPYEHRISPVCNLDD
jgi:hypothetical protein